MSLILGLLPVKNREWFLPVATLTTLCPVSSLTKVGHFLSFASPIPSWPFSLRPHPYTWPISVIANICTEQQDEDTATTFTSSKALRRIGRQIVFSLRGKAPVFRPTSSQSVAPENSNVPLGRSYKVNKN